MYITYYLAVLFKYSPVNNALFCLLWLQAKATQKEDAKAQLDNLAYEYNVNFHTAFTTIGFTTILFVLVAFVIAVGMWNIDPGRDSIIYRLTSQKIKKDQ